MDTHEAYFHSFTEAIQDMFSRQDIRYDARGNLICHRKDSKLSQLPYRLAKQAGYNVECNHFYMYAAKTHCTADMDMAFCSSNCPYATNMVCSTKVYAG